MSKISQIYETEEKVFKIIRNINTSKENSKFLKEDDSSVFLSG